MRSPLRPRDITPFLLALAAGCGESPIGGFDDEVCPYAAPGLGDLAPAGADYVALRTRSDVEDGAPTILNAWGTPCSAATDAAACQAALSALPLAPPLTSDGFDLRQDYDVVFTRGDEVGRAGTQAELLALLGTIDTQGEAALVALAANHRVFCGENNVRLQGTSFVVLGTRGSGCGDDVEHFEISVSGPGTVTLGEAEVVEEGDETCAIGRRPVALRSRGPRLGGVGAFFARAAHLEAASVPAFRHLGRELAAHRAPRGLVRACVRSAADEVRHARIVSRLARRYGATTLRPVVDPMPIRDLADVALDNATEGCVRETFGAVVAGFQARRAQDPVVRRALAGIAADEARHAALSWKIDAWAAPRLSPADRARVLEARREATRTLAREIERPTHAIVMRYAGMPGVAEGKHLFREMTRGLGLDDAA